MTIFRGGLFQWLLYQAKKGVAGTNAHIGGILYNGKQGLQKNLAKAFDYFQSASREDTKNSNIDYNVGIMKLKGEGVEKDLMAGLEALEKSASANNPAALVGLGYHFLMNENDADTAIGYFEQAERFGNPDAMHNLAVLNSQGKYPGKPPDQIFCFHQYLKAAQLGHVESAYNLVNFYMDGIAGALPVIPGDALVWAKFVIAESNTSVRSFLRKGLMMTTQKKKMLSLLYYGIAASTGSELGAFNSAILINDLSRMTSNDLAAENYFLKQASSGQYVTIHREIWNMLGENILAQRKHSRESEKAFVRAALMNLPRAYFNLSQLKSISPDSRKKLRLFEVDFGEECLNRCIKFGSAAEALPCWIYKTRKNFDRILQIFRKRMFSQ